MAEERLKVLLLDDERILLDLYRVGFEKRGFDVMAFNDADDALNLLRQGYKPDIILFDITMPESKSGYEFIETVSAEGLAKGALKVALTNEGQDGAMNRTSELGADAHLLKVKHTPVQLVEAVKEMLEKRT